MDVFVIHIGLPKAGSASIQSFLSLNQDALRAMSIDYPTIGRGLRKDHHNLSSELKGRKNFEPEVGTLADLRAYAALNPCPVRIISSEKFEKLEAQQVAELKLALRTKNSQFRIIMIVRDLLELMRSSYGQKIRYGFHTYDFDTFFEGRIQEERTSYFDTAKKWAEVFRWNRMSVRFLAPQHLTNGDLIDEFLKIAGADVGAPEFRSLPRPGVVNSTSDWRMLEALRALYGGEHGLPSDHPLVKFTSESKNGFARKIIETAAIAVCAASGWNGESAQYLTRDQAQRTLELYRQSIVSLNTYLSEPLPMPLNLEERGFVDREFLPDATEIPTAELLGFYEQLNQSLAKSQEHKATRKSGRVWDSDRGPPPSN